MGFIVDRCQNCEVAGIISFLYTWLAETDADTQNGRRHPGKTRNPPTVLG